MKSENNSIIINNVNVAGCEFFRDKYSYYSVEGVLYMNAEGICTLSMCQKCERTPNCYYKELQRLKKENELLKTMFNI